MKKNQKIITETYSNIKKKGLHLQYDIKILVHGKD